MAAFRPELFTIEEVLNFYNQTEGNEYKIFAGTSPNDAYKRYHYEGEKEIGMQELAAALHQLRGNTENYNPYLIQIITPPKGKGKAFQPSLTSITFQLNRPAAYMPMQQQGMISGRGEMLLEKLVEQNQMLISRVSALEAEEDEDQEPEQEEGLAGILKNPEIQSMLIGAIGRFISGNTPAPAAIAGIPKSDLDYTEAVQILDSLMSKGVTLEHLRALDKMSQVKLNSLILML